MDHRPALDRTPVPGLPVGVVGIQREGWIDDEVEDCLVLKPHVNAVVIAAGKEFDALQRLALGLFKEVEAASGIATDGGLAALRFLVSQQGRDSLVSEFGLQLGGIAPFGCEFGLFPGFGKHTGPG